MSLTDEELSALAWRTSTMSAGGNCVEVAPAGGMVAVRDSKNPAGPVLYYTGDEWRAFLGGAKQGEFDDLA